MSCLASFCSSRVSYWYVVTRRHRGWQGGARQDKWGERVRVLRSCVVQYFTLIYLDALWSRLFLHTKYILQPATLTCSVNSLWVAKNWRKRLSTSLALVLIKGNLTQTLMILSFLWEASHRYWVTLRWASEDQQTALCTHIDLKTNLLPQCYVPWHVGLWK